MLAVAVAADDAVGAMLLLAAALTEADCDAAGVPDILAEPVRELVVDRENFDVPLGGADAVMDPLDDALTVPVVDDVAEKVASPDGFRLVVVAVTVEEDVAETLGCAVCDLLASADADGLRGAVADALREGVIVEEADTVDVRVAVAVMSKVTEAEREGVCVVVRLGEALAVLEGLLEEDAATDRDGRLELEVVALRLTLPDDERVAEIVTAVDVADVDSVGRGEDVADTLEAADGETVVEGLREARLEGEAPLVRLAVEVEDLVMVLVAVLVADEVADAVFVEDCVPAVRVAVADDDAVDVDVAVASGDSVAFVEIVAFDEAEAIAVAVALPVRDAEADAVRDVLCVGDRVAVGEACVWHFVRFMTMSCSAGFVSATISMPREMFAFRKKICACASTSGHAVALCVAMVEVSTAKFPVVRLSDAYEHLLQSDEGHE